MFMKAIFPDFRCNAFVSLGPILQDLLYVLSLHLKFSSKREDRLWRLGGRGRGGGGGEGFPIKPCKVWEGECFILHMW